MKQLLTNLVENTFEIQIVKENFNNLEIPTTENMKSKMYGY